MTSFKDDPVPDQALFERRRRARRRPRGRRGSWPLRQAWGCTPSTPTGQKPSCCSYHYFLVVTVSVCWLSFHFIWQTLNWHYIQHEFALCRKFKAFFPCRWTNAVSSLLRILVQQLINVLPKDWSNILELEIWHSILRLENKVWKKKNVVKSKCNREEEENLCTSLNCLKTFAFLLLPSKGFEKPKTKKTNNFFFYFSVDQTFLYSI